MHSGRLHSGRHLPESGERLTFHFCLAPSTLEAMNASQMARALGRRGGRARGRRLSLADRQRIASLGGEARRRSLQAARRIMDNLRYAAAARDLQGRREPLQRLRAFAGPLPGIYPTGS